MSDPVVELSFGAGLDEATRDELIEPGSGWAELVNVRQDKRGAVTKRLAFASLVRTRLSGSRAAGNRLLSYKGSPAVIDGTDLDVYSESIARSTTIGRVPEVGVSTFAAPALGITSSSIVADVVYCNGYLALAHFSSTAIGGTNYAHVSLLDAETQHVVSGPTAIASATSATLEKIALCTYGTYVILVTPGVTANTITAYYLDTTSATTIATGWVAFGASLATNWGLAVAVSSMSDRCAIAYGNTSGGASQLSVKTFDITGVLQSTTVNTAGATPDCVGLGGSKATTLWVSWNQGSTVKACGLSGSAITSVLATTATVIAGPYAPERIHVVEWFTAYPAIGSIGMVVASINSTVLATQTVSMAAIAGATTVAGTSEILYGTLCTGRPFLKSERIYMPLYSGSDVVIADVTPNQNATAGNWYARPIAAPIFTSLFSGDANSCQIALDASGRAVTVLHMLRSAAVTAPIGVCLDFEATSRWRTAEHNGLTILGGGLLTAFEGGTLAEVNFCFRPTKPTTSQTGTGPTTTLGGWRYVLVYEDIDTAGNWIQSGVSAPSTITGNFTNKSIALAISPLSVTMRTRTTTRIAAYRTRDGGEAPYFRVGVVANAPGTASLTITDGTSDATLATQATLYGTGNLPATNGAAQDRRAPPFAQDVLSYNGMCVVASGLDLWWSGQTVGGEGTWWSPAFVVSVEGTDPLTALAVQDGTLFAFTRRSIFAVAGESPADNGSSGGLGTPRRLATDVGCVDPNSVVVTSMGVFFQSERGIELLSRGGAVQWIGGDIQTTLATYPVVSSAVLDDRNGLVRLSLAAASSGGRVSGNGRDVVFDLVLGAWQSVDDKTGAGAHEASQDAAMLYVDGAWRYGWLGANGTVYYERLSSDASAHLDGSTWVTQSAVSPWVAIAGRNGEQFIDQVLLLAKSITGHDLTISVAFDFSDSYTNTKTFTATQIAALAREWLVREITQTTSQAVRVKLEDATPSSGSVGTGKGATWIALSFNGQPHRGPKRTSSAQRGG